MALSKGDRVIATENVAAWALAPTVRKGTEGVVIDDGGFFGWSVTVRFDDGDTVSGLEEGTHVCKR